MSDIEPDYGSDQEVSANHSKLIEAVSKLDKGQRVKKPQRSEPSLEVSEFHLVKSGISDKDAVHIEELAQTLGGKGHHADISKKLQTARQKTKVLPKPLEKPAADKLKRAVGYENTVKDLRAWNAIVARNRTAETLTFPLTQSTGRLPTTNEFVKRFRLQSELEKELEKLEPPKPIVEEKVDEFPLTLEEIMQKRKEAAKFRAQQSYKEAKAHRQNKIKSKKFHRIQRKARIKQQLKEFEELQKTDPQAALLKLEELDKTRAEERMSLRHKSTGQWAKNKQVRAKYDKDSRQVLAQQLSISKALTQKIRSNDDSDEDEEVPTEVAKPSKNDEDNPWVNGVKTSEEINDFISGYRKYWDEKNKASSDQGKSDEEKKSSEAKVSKSAIPNPVESVTEEYEDSGENVDSKKQSQTKIRNKKSRELSKRHGKSSEVQEKSSNKENLNKMTELKKAGTSDWYVEPVVPLVQPKKKSPKKKKSTTKEESPLKRQVDIDDLFESMEKKMHSRIDAKVKNIKRTLSSTEPAMNNSDTNSKNKKKPKDYNVDELAFKKQKLRPDFDIGLDESVGISGNQAIKTSTSLTEDSSMPFSADNESTSQKKANEIDPNKFINVKPKHLITLMPDTMTNGDEALDDNEEDEDQQNIISEAFADDDVVEEFRKEKAEEVKKSQPEDIDLRLPGWGSWGGKNIVNSTRKKRRFILKFPKVAKRRDENKGDVVILEEKDAKIREHQVSDLPYPFNTVKDFEASIRAPIGRNFVPENAHKRLIRPAVKTKMGAIIEPMDAQALVKKNLKPRRRTAALKKDKTTVDKIQV
ncbi:U3 small nucleolar RNA-associated protein 14 homolog B [Venturia canescens]|uniref:U3 small nucleolar RNA-associated protein 14 homolog B n=1 Tax=Venturia canescens TaxID=32260 RepID=UPI001C9C651D|nr:U3 small nucleolar RNA-associated protein 14 homolog B [Venturia canescens]